METGFFFLLIPLDAFDIQVSSESRLSFQEARDLSSPCGSRETVKFSFWCCFFVNACLMHRSVVFS